MRAYDQGCFAAKTAFSVEDFVHSVKGHVGPLLSSFFTGHPLTAGLSGAAGQVIDQTPPGGSRLIRSAGVGLGAAGANALVGPVAGFLADAVVSAMGLKVVPPGAKHMLGSAGRVIHSLIRNVPTGIAQTYAGEAGRDTAIGLEQFLKKKDMTLP